MSRIPGAKGGRRYEQNTGAGERPRNGKKSSVVVVGIIVVREVHAAPKHKEIPFRFLLKKGRHAAVLMKRDAPHVDII